MFKSKSGFTIVELLIVIVVIGILAAITVVAYTGVQDKARNAQMLSAVDTYEKALLHYKVLNGHYPKYTNFIGTFACLGGPFPESAPLAEDSCYRAGSVAYSRENEVDAAIATILNTQPTTQNELKLSSDEAVRGIQYTIQGDASADQAAIMYFIKGNQECGRGHKIASDLNGSPVTICQTFLQ